MPELTDEEKNQAILDGVERPLRSDDPNKDSNPNPDSDDPAHEDNPENGGEPTNPEPDEEANTDGEPSPTGSSEPPVSFTKKFPNLKGDTAEEYVPSLEEAYANSTNEALRLKKELDDKEATFVQAQQIVAQAQANGAAPAVPPTAPTDPSQPTTPVQTSAVPPATQPVNPDLAWAKAAREKEMLDSFGKFREEYPQSVDPANFQNFLNASKGVEDAWKASHGGILPTYDELYKGIASILGWEPITVVAKKNDAIKNATTQSRPSSSTAPVPTKPKISGEQVDLHLRMYPGKTRDQAIKDLSEVVA